MSNEARFLPQDRFDNSQLSDDGLNKSIWDASVPLRDLSLPAWYESDRNKEEFPFKSFQSLCALASRLTDMEGQVVSADLTQSSHDLHAVQHCLSASTLVFPRSGVSMLPVETTSKPTVFLPRSFNGIREMKSTENSVHIDDGGKDDVDTEELVQSSKPLSRSEWRRLREVSKSIYDKFFEAFITAANSHNCDQMLDFYLTTTRSDVKTIVKYWNRSDVAAGSASRNSFIIHDATCNNEAVGTAGSMGSTSTTDSTQFCNDFTTLGDNPLGLQNHIEISGYRMEKVKEVVQQTFNAVPDSIILQRSTVRVLQSRSGLVRAVVQLSFSGTAVVYTTVQNLQQSWLQQNYPYIISQHPAFLGSILAGIGSMMNVSPIPIAVNINTQLEGYGVAYFDESSGKVVNFQCHYFQVENRSSP